jgi:hypothetical protein
MKILHICAIGATAKVLLKPQIDYLLSRNLSVEVACSPDSDVEKLQQQGYTIHPISIDRKISPFLNIKSIYALVNLIRNISTTSFTYILPLLRFWGGSLLK